MKEREKALKADKKAAETAQKLSVNQGATEAKLSRSSTRTNTEIAALEKQELGAPAESQAKEKPNKDRKFCILLSKGLNGERDPAWIRAYMGGGGRSRSPSRSVLLQQASITKSSLVTSEQRFKSGWSEATSSGKRGERMERREHGGDGAAGKSTLTIPFLA